MPGTPDSPDTMSYVRSLPEAECFELLAVAVVGRVGFASPAGLQIIPMSYRLGTDRQIFMKTAPSSALARLAAVDAPVAFEVDYHGADFRIAWSVLMNGTIADWMPRQRRRTRNFVGRQLRGPGQPAPYPCASCRGPYLGAICTARTQTEGRRPRRSWHVSSTPDRSFRRVYLLGEGMR
jgi:hypothetical protein